MHGVPLEVERVGKVTVVRITEKSLIQEREVSEVKETLKRLAGESGSAQMLLDFEAVVALTSGMLSILLSLRKDLRDRGGRLAVCGLLPGVRQIFGLVGLRGTLNIYPTEREALESFQDAQSPAAAAD